jgi:hypothetical protein
VAELEKEFDNVGSSNDLQIERDRVQQQMQRKKEDLKLVLVCVYILMPILLSRSY